MEKKICSKCKIEKDVCEFGILKSSKDGFRNVCKECRARDEKNSNLKYRQKNKEKVAKYYQTNKEYINKRKTIKVICECGSEFRCSGKAEHLRSTKHKKHKKYIEDNKLTEYL